MTRRLCRNTVASGALVWLVSIGSSLGQPAPAAGVRHSTGRATSHPVAADRFTRTEWAPGGRTFWHIHPRGQIILADQGHVRVQLKGKPVVELVPGDEPLWTPPNVAHWHGAAPTEGGRYLATTPGGEADVTWMDEVSEQDYTQSAVPGRKPER